MVNIRLVFTGPKYQFLGREYACQVILTFV